MEDARRSNFMTRGSKLIVVLLIAQALFMGTQPVPALQVAHPVVGMAATPSGNGYWVVASDGGIFAFGDAGYFGSMGGKPLASPVVGMAPTPSGNGYWLVASDGGMFAFGDAGYFGSMGGKPLASPVVGMASTASGNGYWLVASDGGMFAFGDAGFFGSMGGQPLASPVVGMAPTASGNGYWLVASDGGMFSFGDAGFFGSMGGRPLASPVVGMAPTPSGNGYWLVASDGGMFSFGDAGFFGSMGGRPLASPIVGMAAHPSGNGYWLVARDGGIFTFGNINYFGSVPGIGTETPPPPPPPPPDGAAIGWVDRAALEVPQQFTQTALPVFLESGDGTTFLIQGKGDHPDGPYGSGPGGTNCPNDSDGLAVVDAFESTDTSKSRGAFNNGATVWLNDAIVKPTATVGVSGRFLESGPHSMSGLNVSMQYFTGTNNALLRTFVTLENPSTQTVLTTVTVSSNLGSGASAAIPAAGTFSPTSTGGDNIFTTADRWAITSWTSQNNRRDRAVIANVFSGPGSSATSTKVSNVDSITVPGDPGRVFFCAGTRQGIAMDLQVAVPAAGVKSLVFFQQLFVSNTAAASGVLPYNSTTTVTPEMLQGLSASQVAQIANWSFPFSHFFAAGPGAGGGPRPKIMAVGPSTSTVGTFSSFLAYDEAMRGGASSALSNVQKTSSRANDAEPQLIVGPGPDPNVPPVVKIHNIDPKTGKPTLFPTTTLFATMTYGESFRGGVQVAAGDLEFFTTRREVVIAPMTGIQPIKVFRNVSGSLWEEFASWTPDFGPNWQGGMTLAIGDVDADGREEIIVGGGPGASPQVLIFVLDEFGKASDVYINGHRGFNPYPGWTGGVNVASGDFDGPTTSPATDVVQDEIVTGMGPGGNSSVQVFRFMDSSKPLQVLFQTMAFPFGGGTRVAVTDLDDVTPTDGTKHRKSELVVGAGPGEGDPLVKIYKLNVTDPDNYTLDTYIGGPDGFLVYNSGFRGGVWVSSFKRKG